MSVKFSVTPHLSIPQVACDGSLTHVRLTHSNEVHCMHEIHGDSIEVLSDSSPHSARGRIPLRKMSINPALIRCRFDYKTRTLQVYDDAAAAGSAVDAEYRGCILHQHADWASNACGHGRCHDHLSLCTRYVLLSMFQSLCRSNFAGCQRHLWCRGVSHDSI